ncbi:glycosyltransferase family 2 protein [Egibacter rhizosphaerae]|uniref:Glycosyltransferase family 2 protein n=2 Tax=Egibacter rhizosphaerae TaxID=1670831 RepID=A0A411YLL7_9ACTN|nr:glycosyltransferase family 2 protein [Egibacter rhizosphaerae]
MAVRDEQAHLGRALDAVLAQDYAGLLEVCVAVAPSHDGTEELAREVAARDRRVAVTANPRGVTPAGLNAAIAATSGDVVVRVDGHAVLPPGYVRRAVELLAETGADNVGGIMAAEGDTPFTRAVAAAMTSRFGTGDARFHTGGRPGPVDTVYLGVFRRAALERVGHFDERLVRTQDAELNHRIRQSGGQVWFHPDLRVAYRPRDSLRGLARQYFEYGRWRRAVVRRHPDSLALRQLAPPAALVGTVAGAALGLTALAGRSGLTGPAGRTRPAGGTLGRAPERVRALALAGWVAPLGYLLAVLGASAAAGRGLEPGARLRLPLVFATMHGCWAVGFLTSPRDLGT